MRDARTFDSVYTKKSLPRGEAARTSTYWYWTLTNIVILLNKQHKIKKS
jgi:hypothetical protein